MAVEAGEMIGLTTYGLTRAGVAWLEGTRGTNVIRPG